MCTSNTTITIIPANPSYFTQYGVTQVCSSSNALSQQASNQALLLSASVTSIIKRNCETTRISSSTRKTLVTTMKLTA